MFHFQYYVNISVLDCVSAYFWSLLIDGHLLAMNQNSNEK